MRRRRERVRVGIRRARLGVHCHLAKVVSYGRGVHALGSLPASVADAKRRFAHDVSASAALERVIAHRAQLELVYANSMRNLVVDAPAGGYENSEPPKRAPQRPVQAVEPLFQVVDSALFRQRRRYRVNVPAEFAVARLQVVRDELSVSVQSPAGDYPHLFVWLNSVVVKGPSPGQMRIRRQQDVLGGENPRDHPQKRARLVFVKRVEAACRIWQGYRPNPKPQRLQPKIVLRYFAPRRQIKGDLRFLIYSVLIASSQIMESVFYISVGRVYIPLFSHVYDAVSQLAV